MFDFLDDAKNVLQNMALRPQSEVVDYLEKAAHDPWIPLNLTSCPAGIFNSTQTKLYYQSMSSFVLFLPAIVIIAVLAMTAKRKNLWHKLWHGQVALPIPVNFHDEQLNRSSLCCAWGLAVAIVIKVVVEGHSNHFSVGYFLAPVVTLMITVLTAFVLYGMFASITSRRPIMYVIGGVYTGCLIFLFAVFDWPCAEMGSLSATFYIVNMLPVWLCVAYLFISLPIRAVFRYIAEQRTQGARQRWQPSADGKGHYREPTGDKARNTRYRAYQAHYVCDLLSPDDHVRNRLQQSTSKFGKYIYRSVPNFRYSCTIFLAINTSMVVSYFIAFIFVRGYYHLRYFAFSMAQVSYLMSTHPAVTAMLNVAEREKAGFVANVVHGIKESAFWFDSFVIVGNASTFIAMFINWASLLSVYPRYRMHMLQMYRGKRLMMHDRVKKYSPVDMITHVTRFVGYQIAYNIWGMFVQVIAVTWILQLIYTLAVAIVRYDLIPPEVTVGASIGVAAVIIVILKIIQHIMCRYVFTQTLDGKPVLGLDNRRLANNAMYFGVFLDIPAGLVSVVIRFIKTWAMNVWLQPRLDMSTLNRSFEWLDGGYESYLCLLEVENAHNNPVMATFCHLLLAATFRVESPSHLIDDRETDIQTMKLITPSKARVSSKARTKWHVAYTLIRNPDLIKRRKSAFLDMQAESPMTLKSPIPGDSKSDDIGIPTNFTKQPLTSYA